MDDYSLFLEFLRSNSCEKEFRENFYSYNGFTAFCRDLWDIMVGDEYFLNRAFCWADTAQGKPYWRKLSDEWERIYCERLRSATV